MKGICDYCLWSGVLVSKCRDCGGCACKSCAEEMQNKCDCIGTMNMFPIKQEEKNKVKK